MDNLIEKYISSAEAAKILGIYTASVNRLVRQGIIPAVKITGGWLLSRAFVEDMAKKYEGRRGRPRRKRKYTKRGVSDEGSTLR